MPRCKQKIRGVLDLHKLLHHSANLGKTIEKHAAFKHAAFKHAIELQDWLTMLYDTCNTCLGTKWVRRKEECCRQV